MKRIRIKSGPCIAGSVVLLSLFSSTTVWASATANAQNLPWEGSLSIIQKSLSGPVAFAISLIAIVITGAALLFGGELSEFGRRMCLLALVIAMLVGANTILTTLFTSAMLIP